MGLENLSGVSTLTNANKTLTAVKALKGLKVAASVLKTLKGLKVADNVLKSVAAAGSEAKAVSILNSAKTGKLFAVVNDEIATADVAKNADTVIQNGNSTEFVAGSIAGLDSGEISIAGATKPSASAPINITGLEASEEGLKNQAGSLVAMSDKMLADSNTEAPDAK